VVVRKGSSSIAENKRRKENIEMRGDWCAWIDLDGTVSEKWFFGVSFIIVPF